GSICGTFLAGFVLIAYFGSTSILLVLSGTLAALSLCASTQTCRIAKVALLVASMTGLPLVASYAAFMARQGLTDVDTPYQKVLVSEGKDERSGRAVRLMMTNPGETQSAMYLDGDDELVLEYTKFFRLATHFNPRMKNALMIGGAGYSYPKDYLLRHRHAAMDVVEIDPGVTALARRYFNLKDDPRLTIHHEDARTYLNRSRKTYDAIFGDAYRSFYSIPYHLATREAARKMYERLSDDGVVLVNIISAIEGEKGKFLRAEYATFRSVFPQVYLFTVGTNGDGSQVQNIVLVALKSEMKAGFHSDDEEMDGYLRHLWAGTVSCDLPALTDEYAPVDTYIMEVIRDAM
ncbi:MAG: fused MFS/spermidine synthase, partial [Chloroflexota bacterium]